MTITLKALTAAIGMTMMAAPVFAERDWGLSLGLSYNKNTDTDNTLNELTGQGSYSYDRFGLQFDLVSNDYSFDSQRRSNVGLHAYYNLNQNWKLGAYYGRQDWFGTDYDYYGVEGAFENDLWKVDGYVGKFEPGSGNSNTLFGFDARYLLWDGGFDNDDPFSSGPSSGPSFGPSSGPSSSFGGRYYLIGGWHGVRDNIDENLIYLGASSELVDGLFLDLRMARAADQNQFGVMLRKDFDGGGPFHTRGWTAGFKAW